MATRSEMSQSFGAQAAAYDAGRPEYPQAALEFMLSPLDGVPRLADVGAGTGKLLRSTAQVREVKAIAVDPDAAMLRTLASKTPGVETRVGTAEELPLADESVDAVVLGQAWHWVEPVAGAREIGRVLRKGGVLGLIWNVRDERSEFVQNLTRIMHVSSAESMMTLDAIPMSEPFGSPDEFVVEWTRKMTREAVLLMAQSRSYLITAEPEEREQILSNLGELLDSMGIVGEREVDLPYVTKVFRYVRP